jgi:hypothetical protein
MAKRVEQKVLAYSMNEFRLKAEIYRIIAKSKIDLRNHHPISVIYEKIAGKDFLIFMHFTEPEANVASSRSMEHGRIRC